ncbi:MAG: hypothetical protein QOH73_1748 [Gaiellaceae bacterium]|nr:hypothetical protein [Gaiellaceae bacterium]
MLFLGLFVVWNFLSISWAVSKGIAWDGANRSLLYFVVFLLFLLPLPGGRQTIAVVCSLVAGIAGIGLLTIVHASSSADPHSFLVAGRLSQPAGYPNAASALFLLPFWAAVWLGSRAASRMWVRMIALASAGVLLELGTLPQSRATVIAMPLTLLLFFALVPGRVRALIALLPVVAAWLLALPRLLDVYTAARAEGGGLLDAFLAVRHAVAITAAALAVAAVVFSLVDARLELRDTTLRRIRIGVAALVGACVIAGGVLVARAVPHPIRRLDSAWTNFKQVADPAAAAGANRFTSIGSNRYDFWRVAMHEFKQHPLVGVGSDNFAIDYLRERRSGEEPLYPHSLVLRLLSETGLVGTVLFAAFLLSAGFAIGRTRWRGTLEERGLAAVAATCFGYWVIHGAVDWLWEFPALGAMAFMLLALACGARTEGQAPARTGRRLPLLLLAPVAVVALLSFALPWLAARATARAQAVWQSDPQAAYRDLDRARSLNRLSEEPDMLTALIAARTGDRATMAVALERSRKRLPENWYVHFELGLLYGVEHKRDRALAELGIAGRLDPGEPEIQVLRKAVVENSKLTLTTPDAAFIQRIDSRTR